ncbi:MAG: hypothetical protein IJZ44_01195 [Lachnospiraceae bacterium]|nr:hypothetical protein [Lachnospiraceae bacterium]
MTAKEIYRIWAPAGKAWVDWVRPVPFIGIGEHSKQYACSSFQVPRPDVSDEIYRDGAVFVDLPGEESVSMGIALAKQGYRPIPVYNGTIEQMGSRATVDNQTVGEALLMASDELSQIEISDDALPVFLLDRNRLNRFKMEIALFDNSWDIYPQDIPSAEYFTEKGIQKIIIIGESVSKDLKKILYDYQKKNIGIYLTNGYEAPKMVKLHRPLVKDKN